MSNRNLVLILGAGASNPYGFPLGGELVFEICKQLRSSGGPQTALRNMGYSQDELDAFTDALRKSSQPSVDAFLEGRPELQELGKAAIAAVLIPHELEEKLIRHKNFRDWYEYLFTRLATAKKEDFPAFRMKVVTFNYDRSFERALEIAIQYSYGVSEAEAIAIRKKVEVIHVYGSLGPFPHEASTDARPYDAEVSQFTVAAAAKSIQIVSEGRKGHAALERARSVVAEAREIVFLGFGYHPENLSRLGFPLGHHVEMMGSCFGMTSTERNTANTQVVRGYSGISFFGESLGCLSCLRDVPFLCP